MLKCSIGTKLYDQSTDFTKNIANKNFFEREILYYFCKANFRKVNMKIRSSKMQTVSTYLLRNSGRRFEENCMGLQWWIQNFWGGGGATPEGCAYLLFCKIFDKHCMKMKEFGPGIERVPGASLDPPLDCLN